jgi:hypothetical protein
MAESTSNIESANRVVERAYDRSSVPEPRTKCVEIAELVLVRLSRHCSSDISECLRNVALSSHQVQIQLLQTEAFSMSWKTQRASFYWPVACILATELDLRKRPASYMNNIGNADKV